MYFNVHRPAMNIFYNYIFMIMNELINKESNFTDNCKLTVLFLYQISYTGA